MMLKDSPRPATTFAIAAACYSMPTVVGIGIMLKEHLKAEAIIRNHWDKRGRTETKPQLHPAKLIPRS
jgi:hypothetical protein